MRVRRTEQPTRGESECTTDDAARLGEQWPPESGPLIRDKDGRAAGCPGDTGARTTAPGDGSGTQAAAEAEGVTQNSAHDGDLWRTAPAA